MSAGIAHGRTGSCTRIIIQILYHYYKMQCDIVAAEIVAVAVGN